MSIISRSQVANATVVDAMLGTKLWTAHARGAHGSLDEVSLEWMDRTHRGHAVRRHAKTSHRVVFPRPGGRGGTPHETARHEIDTQDVMVRIDALTRISTYPPEEDQCLPPLGRTSKAKTPRRETI